MYPFSIIIASNAYFLLSFCKLVFPFLLSLLKSAFHVGKVHTQFLSPSTPEEDLSSELSHNLSVSAAPVSPTQPSRVSDNSPALICPA